MTPRLLTLFMIPLLLVVEARPSFAAEVASGDLSGQGEASIERKSLGPADVTRLIRGELPTLKRLDSKYQSRSVDSICRTTWSDLRSTPVRPRAVGPTITVLKANAARAGLSFRKLKNALAVYLKNQNSLPNQHHLTVVDFDKPSTQKRLFTVDLRTGAIESFFTTAGRRSDPDADGYATRFSNKSGSEASSLGCYVANGEYRSPTKQQRRSLVLHGLEATNDNACQRHVVMHPAKYVGSGAGRSNGCLALLPKDINTVYDRVGGGGLICSYREGAITEAGGGSSRGAHRSSSRRKHARHHRVRHAGRSYANY